MRQPKYSIRKDDQVMVTCGKDRGRTGRVARVIPSRGAVVVEKLNMIKRHTRPSALSRHGGIIEKEAPLNISNVAFLCSKCKVPVRLGKKTLKDGKKVRFCRKCGEVIDK